jgi:cell division protein FtsB
VAAAVDHRPDHEAVRRGPLRAISSQLARRRRRPEENDDAGGGDGDSSATDASAEADESSARHRWRTVARTAAWTSAILAVAVVLLVFVFPTRTYLSQRHQLALTAAELRLLDQQNAQLSAQVARLQTDAEIERLAREQYHFVRPGERAFAILPAPPPPTTTPPPRPPAAPSRGLLHRLTSWIP